MLVTAMASTRAKCTTRHHAEWTSYRNTVSTQQHTRREHGWVALVLLQLIAAFGSSGIQGERVTRDVLHRAAGIGRRAFTLNSNNRILLSSKRREEHNVCTNP